RAGCRCGLLFAAGRREHERRQPQGRGEARGERAGMDLFHGGLDSKRAVILVRQPGAANATGKTVSQGCGARETPSAARCGPSAAPYDVAPFMALHFLALQVPHSTRRQRAGLGLSGLAVLGAGLLASCRCTDTARAYAHTSDDSPRAALERFELY